MSVVYLIRHGQASFGAADYDVLSPTGHRQAEVLGEELRSRGVDPAQAWSGTLARQRDTARIALEAAGVDLPCQTDPRWNEYDHLGLVQHHLAAARTTGPASPREFQAVLDAALHSWVNGGPAAGSFADFEAGAWAALAETEGTAVVFTSGGVIAALCSRLLGLPGAAVVALNRVVVNAAITKVVTGRSGATLVSFNEHGHFEGPNRDLLTYR
ncbi:histidine phosphatase family protein [Actinokineospora sp. NBRC 105648]|uniref:histidine phosphatase family protein n=1 Tax=Actinokineospora sp. NBRC 105648 TaxID=3032206 RepID=UPI0024A1B549|nr:histidine phosphatase family protein [Actinokineospora sp. NBRC 105648]GLZ37815.1 fructose 2,6-bisphosphatase [Actinokineospora sp. NBRC 105648]